jgi:hypothetical protein
MPHQAMSNTVPQMSTVVTLDLFMVNLLPWATIKLKNSKPLTLLALAECAMKRGNSFLSNV